MSDCGDGGGPSGGRPARQSSANFLSRLKLNRLANDDSDDYEDDGANMEGDTDYNPDLGKKRLGRSVEDTCNLFWSLLIYNFRKSLVEVVEMDEDSNEHMESVEDLIGNDSSEEEITVVLALQGNNLFKIPILGC